MFIFFAIPSTGQTIVEVVQVEQDEGLLSRQVNKVLRDNSGYFIIFTNNSIQRYDGQNFENIDVHAIKNLDYSVKDFTTVAKLQDGTIIMHKIGLSFLFYIREGENQLRWIEMEGIPIVANKILYLLKPVSEESKKYYLAKVDFNGTINSTVLSRVELPNRIRRLAIKNDVFYLQGSDRTIYYLREKSLEALGVEGDLIQRGNGIYVFDYGAIFKINGKNVTKVANLADRSFECGILKLDEDENIIAAYQGRPRFYDRLYVLDNKDSLHLMSNLTGTTDVFKDFHTDNAFHKWFFGGHNGIHVVSLLRDGSKFIMKSPDTKKGEFGVVISGNATNGKDEVLFVREIVHLYEVDKKDNSEHILFEKLTEETAAYERNSKMYFHEPSDAYYSHSYRYDGKSDVYKSDVKNMESSKYVVPIKLNDIFVRRENEVILGGYISGREVGIIASYDMNSQKYAIIRELPIQVRSIYYDEPTKKYWVGTYDGLYILDDQFNTIEVLDKTQTKGKKLRQAHIVMCNRFNGNIVAGSYGAGIFIIDPLTYKCKKQLNLSNELTDNAAIGIMPDDEGNCWVTTFNGVNVLDENFNVIRRIYEQDGLPNREFNSKAIAKDGDGILYAGTLNGVSVLDPKKVLKWGKSYGIDIQYALAYSGNNVERLELNDELHLFEDYDSIMLHLNLPDYNVYPYVKEVIEVNVDNEEIDYTKYNKKICIKNINYGSYTFDLRPEGTSCVKSITIIRKRNIKKSIVIFMIFAGVSLFAFFISRFLIRRNNHRELEKTKLNKRISELQLTSLQSQMNPHFIFNALGAIQYFIQTHDVDKADEYLSNFAMLMRSILESSKSKFITLAEEKKMLDLYIGLEKVRFEDMFDYEIIVDDNVDTEVNIPPMIIQPFIENAINHGLYNLKERKGQLSIHFSMPKEEVSVITIIDNGVGREAAAKLRMKKHKSRGMQLVQERLETLNDSNVINVKTATIDLYEDQTASGTKIIITIANHYE